MMPTYSPRSTPSVTPERAWTFSSPISYTFVMLRMSMSICASEERGQARLAQHEEDPQRHDDPRGLAPADPGGFPVSDHEEGQRPERKQVHGLGERMKHLGVRLDQESQVRSQEIPDRRWVETLLAQQDRDQDERSQH